MCQRLNTGESNNFYFGIFICIGPLRERIYIPPITATCETLFLSDEMLYPQYLNDCENSCEPFKGGFYTVRLDVCPI